MNDGVFKLGPNVTINWTKNDIDYAISHHEINKKINDDTMLMHAVKINDVNLAKKLLLLKADTRIGDSQNRTPLWLCTIYDRPEITKILLDNNASLEEKNGTNSPLYNAVKHDNNATAKVLIDYGANLNITNIYNKTPLHCAVFRKNYEMVKYLIENGAKTNIRSVVLMNNSLNSLFGFPEDKPETPYEMAINSNDSKMIALFKNTKPNDNEFNNHGNNIKNEYQDEEISHDEFDKEIDKIENIEENIICNIENYKPKYQETRDLILKIENNEITCDFLVNFFCDVEQYEVFDTDIEVIKYIFNNDVNSIKKIFKSNIPVFNAWLTVAIICKNIDILELLLEYGVDPDKYIYPEFNEELHLELFLKICFKNDVDLMYVYLLLFKYGYHFNEANVYNEKIYNSLIPILCGYDDKKNNIKNNAYVLQIFKAIYRNDKRYFKDFYTYYFYKINGVNLIDYANFKKCDKEIIASLNNNNGFESNHKINIPLVINELKDLIFLKSIEEKKHLKKQKRNELKFNDNLYETGGLYWEAWIYYVFYFGSVLIFEYYDVVLDYNFTIFKIITILSMLQILPFLGRLIIVKLITTIKKNASNIISVKLLYRSLIIMFTICLTFFLPLKAFNYLLNYKKITNNNVEILNNRYSNESKELIVSVFNRNGNEKNIARVKYGEYANYVYDFDGNKVGKVELTKLNDRVIEERYEEDGEDNITIIKYSYEDNYLKKATVLYPNYDDRNSFYVDKEYFFENNKIIKVKNHNYEVDYLSGKNVVKKQGFLYAEFITTNNNTLVSNYYNLQGEIYKTNEETFNEKGILISEKKSNGLTSRLEYNQDKIISIYDNKKTEYKYAYEYFGTLLFRYLHQYNNWSDDLHGQELCGNTYYSSNYCKYVANLKITPYTDEDKDGFLYIINNNLVTTHIYSLKNYLWDIEFKFFYDSNGNLLRDELHSYEHCQIDYSNKTYECLNDKNYTTIITYDWFTGEVIPNEK